MVVWKLRQKITVAHLYLKLVNCSMQENTPLTDNFAHKSRRNFDRLAFVIAAVSFGPTVVPTRSISTKGSCIIPIAAPTCVIAWIIFPIASIVVAPGPLLAALAPVVGS